MDQQIINDNEFLYEIDLERMMEIFTIHNTSEILQYSNFMKLQKFDEIINEIEKFSKKTGIMFGKLYLNQNKPLFILVFDYDILIFDYDQKSFQLFQQYITKTNEKITFFFMNQQIKSEI